MKNTFLKLFVFSLVITLSFSSCATLFTKTTYPVSISSNPEGADVTIIDKKGNTIFRGTTPAIARLASSGGYMSGARYDVVLSYPGYISQTVSIKSSVEGWYFGNILFGGLIGMLIVDPASGAMFKLNVDHIYATFEEEDSRHKKSDTPFEKIIKQPVTSSLNILDIKDVPEDMKQYLVKIN